MEAYTLPKPRYTPEVRRILRIEQGLGMLARMVLPLFSEPLVVQGVTSFDEEKRPHLYIVKHESYRDNVTLLALNHLVVHAEPVRVMGKKLYEKIPLLNQFLFTVSRTRYDAFASDEEKQRAREQNRAVLDSELETALRTGVNLGVLPEGTTKTDGSLWKLGKGAYMLSRVRDKKLYCIFIGSTEDLLCGKPLWRIPRAQTFFALSDVHVPPCDTLEEFTKYTYTQFTHLNTLTTSQLAGHKVFKLLEEGGESFTLVDIVETLAKGVTAAREHKLFFDPSLETEEGLITRYKRFCESLERKGYTQGYRITYKLFKDRIYTRPHSERFKKENPLLYHVNRIRSCARYDQNIESVLEQI